MVSLLRRNRAEPGRGTILSVSHSLGVAAAAISGDCISGVAAGAARGNKAVALPSPPPDGRGRNPPGRLGRLPCSPPPPPSPSPTPPLPPVWGIRFLSHPPLSPRMAVARDGHCHCFEFPGTLRRSLSFSLSLLTVFPGNSVVTRCSVSGQEEPLQRTTNQPSCRRCG